MSDQKKLIEMGKAYRTTDGQEVRVLCTDRKGQHPVVVMIIESGQIVSGDAYGDSGPGSPLSLVEVSPYDDFKIDDRVMVRNDGSGPWTPRHFAGVDSEGRPTTWVGGGTSWSGRDRISWQECRRPIISDMGRG